MAIAATDSAIPQVRNINGNGGSNTQERTTGMQRQTRDESNRTSATSMACRVAKGVRTVLLCVLTIPISVVTHVVVGLICGVVVASNAIMIAACSSCNKLSACILAVTVMPVLSLSFGLFCAIEGIYDGIQSGVEMASTCTARPLNLSCQFRDVREWDIRTA